MENKLTEQRKKEIWDEIMSNPGYSRNVNRLEKNNKLRVRESKEIMMTENQKLLMKLFKKLNLDADTIMTIMLIIQSEQEVEEMMDYIVQNQQNLNKEMLIKKAMEINEKD